MKPTQQIKESAQQLLGQARQAIGEDMAARGIGAIIWNNATAGFHFLPAVVTRSADKATVERITGLYLYAGTVWLIEEDKAKVSVDQFYNRDTEVEPTVVTLTESVAKKEFGDPADNKGFTVQGSLEEWTAIADCYFEALNELPNT